MSPTIVCATDFSELSVRAAHIGAEIASRRGASVTLVYVDPPPEFSGLGPDFAALVGAELTEFQRTSDRFVDAHLRKLTGELRSHHEVEVEAKSLRARAADGICELVEQLDTELLVLGHHGAGARRLLLGSVAARVARQTTVPTLVIPASTPTDAPLGRRVLVALDLGGDNVRALIDAGVAMCQSGARLELVSAFHEPAISSLGEAIGIETSLTRLFAMARGIVGERLERLAATVDAPGVEVGVKVETGSPARAVLARAPVFGADLIVVGVRGRRGLEKLIGTNAERLLRHAEVPVLLVPHR